MEKNIQAELFPAGIIEEHGLQKYIRIIVNREV